MKKMAVVVAILMVVGMVPGWCVTAGVESFLDARETSDLNPVSDAAKLTKLTLKPLKPVTNQTRKVTDPVGRETVKAAKTVVNKTWDLLTFKSKRK